MKTRTKNVMVASILACLVLLAISPGPAPGIIIVGNRPPQFPFADVPGIGYAGQSPLLFPDLQLTDIQLWGFSNVQRTNVGADEMVMFDALLSGAEVSGIQPEPFRLTGPVEVLLLGKAGNDTGSFPTEIVSMDLRGSIPGGPTIVLQQSPNLPSPGHTTITDLGGGQWQVDSFFDVFTEISVDGGPFAPSSAEPMRMVLEPEPATLGLLALGGCLVWMRRR